MNLEPLIEDIRSAYRWRKDLLKTEVGLTNRATGICRRIVGYNPYEEDETVKNAKLLESKKLFRSVIQPEKHDHPLRKEAAMSCLPVLIARDGIRKQRKMPEKRIEEFVQRLPAYDWWISINGCAALGLGLLVGEIGDFSSYDNPSKVWQRMGLGGVNTEKGFIPQQKTKDGALARLMGYSPQRRSISWQIGHSLLMKKGPYYDLYLKRKEYEVEQNEKLPDDKKRSKMHMHKRAHKFVEKRLLRNLWRVWRDFD
jgi:hypothetical protein